MNTPEAERLRAEWMSTLKELAPNFFLTFNFGYKIRSLNADKPMIKFFNAIQRKTYGRDWASQFDREWPTAYGFFEHPDTNSHYHVLTRLSGEIGNTLASCGETIWKKCSSRGQLHIEEVRSPDRVWSYCTKRLATQRTFDDIFIYSDTRKKPPL